jgi:hypothetical protein
MCRARVVGIDSLLGLDDLVQLRIEANRLTVEGTVITHERGGILIQRVHYLPSHGVSGARCGCAIRIVGEHAPARAEATDSPDKHWCRRSQPAVQNEDVCERPRRPIRALERLCKPYRIVDVTHEPAHCTTVPPRGNVRRRYGAARCEHSHGMSTLQKPSYDEASADTSTTNHQRRRGRH